MNGLKLTAQDINTSCSALSQAVVDNPTAQYYDFSAWGYVGSVLWLEDQKLALIVDLYGCYRFSADTVIDAIEDYTDDRYNIELTSQNQD